MLHVSLRVGREQKRILLSNQANFRGHSGSDSIASSLRWRLSVSFDDFYEAVSGLTLTTNSHETQVQVEN